ncbi:MAG: conjugal transfer protein TraX [Clostridiales Family XIII bacterium]|jgi:uncharacterized MnhB-related membrane protein|nr:conjugal transfer protein TraX [Clostridiales Family XIII bacterium]
MTLNETQAPAKWGLTGSQLKYIAAALMVFDHVHQMFLANGAPGWFTWLGRPVAPIFIFLCAEGFFYTRSRRKYMLQLFVGYEFMNIASTLLSGAMPNPDVALINNIFGTMFLITVYLLAFDLIRGGIAEKKASRAVLGAAIILVSLLAAAAVLALFGSADIMASMPRWAFIVIFKMIPNIMTTEGGPIMVLMGVIFYVFREKRLLQAGFLVLCSILTFISAPGDSNVQWLMGIAAIGMLLYNGSRGRGGKYFFYVFYPAHIYLLYIAAYFLQPAG